MRGKEYSDLSEITAQSIINASRVKQINSGDAFGHKIGPFNAALYRGRMQLGLEQQDLAEMVGLKEGASISQFETLRYYPNLEMATKIANVFGAGPEQIFPSWLKEFAQDRKRSVKRELSVNEVDPVSLQKAISRESLLATSDLQEQIEHKELLKKMVATLAFLTPRERLVLELRNGLNCDKEHSLRSAGNELGVTDERIRQIEAKALRKLRNLFKRKELRSLFDDQPDYSRCNQALLNGTINAMASGDLTRAQENIEELEQRITQELSLEARQILESLASYKDSFRWDDEEIKKFISWQAKEANLQQDTLQRIKTLQAANELREVWRLKKQLHDHALPIRLG